MDPPPSCEPGAEVDLHARIVSLEAGGQKTRVTVDLRILSRREIPRVRLGGRTDRGAGFAAAFGIPERVLSLPSGRPATVRYHFDLAPGRQHHLFFRAVPEDPSLSGLEAGAWLSVDLDPARQPRRTGNVIQYRAERTSR